MGADVSTSNKSEGIFIKKIGKNSVKSLQTFTRVLTIFESMSQRTIKMRDPVCQTRSTVGAFLNPKFTADL